MSDDESRTHEPSLRETVSEIDALRKLIVAKLQGIRDIIDERDLRYTERDEARRDAVNAALVAVKDQTQASFEASEKAIVKAEEAQRAYNEAHNDLARKMDEQNKATMPRLEIEGRFFSIEEKISTLRSAIDKSEAGGRGMRDVWAWLTAAVAVVIAMVGVFWRR